LKGVCELLIFKRYEGPCGIPIFYQQTPDIIRSSSIALAVFTGSADDLSVGKPGIYHWFEHVPFQGTKKFPDGYRATKGPVANVGGRNGAATNCFYTNYWATLPTRHLSIGFDIVVDLIAQPLLTDEAINAERTIIKQEIRSRMSNLGGNLGYLLPSILWGEHPLGHPIPGSIESLDSMTPELLRKARQRGYDRSRMVFFISTALPHDEVLDILHDRFETLPLNGLSERRMGASFGPLPWNQGERTEIETEFSSSIVQKLFWLPPVRNKMDIVRLKLFCSIFTQGNTGSPLYRVIRETSQLAYNASKTTFFSQDGGYWGFTVTTSRNHIETVEEKLQTILQDPRIRSKEWFEGIKVAHECSLDMQVVNPEENVQEALYMTTAIGQPVTVEEEVEMISQISHQEVLELIDAIDFKDARTVIASGK